MYMRFLKDDYGPENQKFESFRQSLTKFSAALSGWWSLAQIVSGHMLYDWKYNKFYANNIL